MKSYILLLGLLLGGFTAYADSTAKKETEAILIGHVVDSRSGEHLPFITITVKGTTIGTTTDVSGHYLLGNLPVGRPLTVVAQSVGYKSAERSVTLGAHSTTELNFELEEQAVDVGEVVVEIDRNSVIRKETPSLVNILNSKLFERTNAATLADGLSFQPGVRVEDGCQNCGFAQVRINGLDGHYSQILLDSRPLFSALNGVYGLEQIPANMIERVEVIRGGGSALFGASAIGGTINIITKEPLRDWAEIGHTLMSVGCSGAYDNNTTINASLVSNNRKAGIYVYGQNRYRSGYDHDGDGYTELPNLRNQMFGMRSYLRTGDHSKLTLEYHGINEFRRGGNRLDLPAHEANITEQTDHNINGASVAFDLFSRDDRTRHLSVYSAAQQTTRKSYYGGTGEGATDEELENARKAYGRTDGLTVISGAQFLQRFERLLFLPSELTLGVEHSYDHIDDVTIGYDMRTNQKVHILSGVIQNEWKARKWSFLLGGRFDHHNMVDHVIFSPRINLRYNPTEQINLRLNYAGGFRAPQTFDEDLHIALVGGERVVTQLAPDLREERSNSLSASIDLYRSFGSVETNLLVEGFYTALDHIFATRYLPEPNEKGETVLERYNGGGATVAGVNVEAKAAFSRWFDLQAGITWQRSRYEHAQHWSDDAPDEHRMFRSPDWYGYLTANFVPVRRFDISLSGTYTGEMLVQHAAGSGTPVDVAVTTPDFFALNVKLAYEFPILRTLTLQLNAGVQNLFDSYQSDFDQAGSAIPATSTGRRCRAAGSSGRKSASENRCGDTRKKGDVRTTRLPYRSPPANPTYSHTEKRRTQAFRAACWQAAALSSVTGICPFGSGRNVLPPISVRRQGATSAWNHVQAAV